MPRAYFRDSRGCPCAVLVVRSRANPRRETRGGGRHQVTSRLGLRRGARAIGLGADDIEARSRAGVEPLVRDLEDVVSVLGGEIEQLRALLGFPQVDPCHGCPPPHLSTNDLDVQKDRVGVRARGLHRRFPLTEQR